MAKPAMCTNCERFGLGTANCPYGCSDRIAIYDSALADVKGEVNALLDGFYRDGWRIDTLLERHPRALLGRLTGDRGRGRRAMKRWSEGQYVVTPHGDHRVVGGQSDEFVVVLSLDYEHAETWEADRLCTSDEWAEEERCG